MTSLLDRTVTDKIAELIERRPSKTELLDHLADLKYDVQEIEGEHLQLRAAVHALHEQAHGATPWRTCQQYPCVELAGDRDPGPAPLTLPGLL